MIDRERPDVIDEWTRQMLADSPSQQRLLEDRLTPLDTSIGCNIHDLRKLVKRAKTLSNKNKLLVIQVEDYSRDIESEDKNARYLYAQVAQKIALYEQLFL